MNNAARPASLPEYPHAANIPDVSIFDESPDRAKIDKCLRVLEGQLQQARRDIVVLRELKDEALGNPTTFIKLLEDPGKCASRFPRMQTVQFIPPMDLTHYQRRFTRHICHKYDQNLDYLIGKIAEIQAQRPHTPSVSAAVGIHGTPVSALEADGEGGARLVNTRKMIGEWRNKIKLMAGPTQRSTSVPTTKNGVMESPGRESLFSPQPRKAHSVHFTMPFLPSNELLSRNSPPNASNFSSTTSTPSSKFDSGAASPKANGSLPGSEKKRRRMIPGNDSAHHNLPWTEEEKRRLEELLEIYPEEQVQSRRWAKIAAAIGTRTAGQVANRYNKLMMKKRRMEEEEEEDENETIDLGEDLDLIIEDSARQSKEYREYQMLKKSVAFLESNPNASIHHGFRCDACDVEPIVGARWRCTKCNEPTAVDLCQECYDRGDFITTLHRPDHRFIRQKIY